MNKTSRPKLEPYSAIALRNANGIGWRMLALQCPLNDLSRTASRQGISQGAFRFIGSGLTSPQNLDWVMSHPAISTGWIRDSDFGSWFPIDDPLPKKISGAPELADVSLNLDYIRYGYIAFTISTGTTTVGLQVDDVWDSLVVWVRFIQLLGAGGEPHANMAENGFARFRIESCRDQDLCRFHLAVKRDNKVETIDILTDRRQLWSEFRDFAKVIAAHPFFAHHFVNHICLPADEYERAAESAEREWENGVEAGRFPNDLDQELEFTAARIVAEVTMGDECIEVADKEREMLRTLEIPDAWLVRDGLVNWYESERLP